MTDQNANQQPIVFDDALFKRFARGELSPQVEARVAQYLESHPDLLQQVAAVSADGFLKRVQTAAKRTSAEATRESTARNSDRTPQPDKNADSSKKANPPKNVGSLKNTGSLKEVPVPLSNYAGYEIIRELGRGGMGVVYLAKNLPMDRLEVLKVLSQRLLNNAGAKERFLREIRSVSRLSHPNIVTSYAVLPLDDLTVFAMEYVHGMDLHQYVAKSQPIPVQLACSFTKQIAAGLQHAHQRGLVHRDIKPSNVIVYKSNGNLLVKILDFGLSKASSEKQAAGLTVDGTLLGTPEYMSPEQTLNPSATDVRADIYSLGCTLYFMLVGKAPFSGTHGSVLLAHAQQEPPSIALIRPDVPPQLLAVVNKMMAKEVEKRYQEPREIVAALAPFLKTMQSPMLTSTQRSVDAMDTVRDRLGSERNTPPDLPKIESPELDVESVQLDQAQEPTPRLPSRPVGGAQPQADNNARGRKLIEAVAIQSTDESRSAEILAAEDQVAIESRHVETGQAQRPKARRRLILGSATVCVLLAAIIGGALTWGSSILSMNATSSVEQPIAPDQVEIPAVSPAFVASHTTGTIGQQTESSEVVAGAEPLTSSDGYVSLFNGEDLAGWTISGNPNAIWRVVNGELVATWQPGKSYTGGSQIVADRRDYKNFRFRIETIPTKNWACSLVFWWDESPSFRKYWTRAQIGAASGDQQMDTGILRTSVFGTSGVVAAPRRPLRIRPNEWFTEEVEVIDNRVRVYVDDIMRTEHTMAERPQGGSIGIALSGGAAMKIRKIEVKELP